MNNISFVELFYPVYSNPNAKAYLTLSSLIRLTLHYADKYSETFRDVDWNLMHERYAELKGAVEACEAMGVISEIDRFRIPHLVYKVAMKKLKRAKNH